MAQQEGGYGQLYQHFAHFLETDAIYLLNDAMEILPKGDSCASFQQMHCFGRLQLLTCARCSPLFLGMHWNRGMLSPYI